MTTINSDLCQRSRSYISMAHASWIGSLRVGLQILRINEEITSIDIKPIAVGLWCRWGVGGHSRAAGKAMGEMLQPGCSQSAQVGGVPAWVRLSTTQKFLKLPDYGLLEQNIGTCGQAELEKYSSGAPATLVLCFTGRRLLKKWTHFHIVALLWLF